MTLSLPRRRGVLGLAALALAGLFAVAAPAPAALAAPAPIAASDAARGIAPATAEAAQYVVVRRGYGPRRYGYGPRRYGRPVIVRRGYYGRPVVVRRGFYGPRRGYYRY